MIALSNTPGDEDAADPHSGTRALHVICERDVGLFALVMSVIPHVYRAKQTGRTPVVYYSRRCCYWTPDGHNGSDTVWEYYFEPVSPDCSVSTLPSHLRQLIDDRPPDRADLGYYADPLTFVSCHHDIDVRFDGESPKKSGNLGSEARRRASEIIEQHVRPRSYIALKAADFLQRHLEGSYVIGVHIRGTDASVDPDRAGGPVRPRLGAYYRTIARLLEEHSDSRIFIASDSQIFVDRIRRRFGSRVISYESVRHQHGELAGRGPTGRIMPAFLTRDSNCAAQNGEDAVVEYLLLCHSRVLVHNGSSIPRMVLLTRPDMPDIFVGASMYRSRTAVGRQWRRMKRYATRTAELLRMLDR